MAPSVSPRATITTNMPFANRPSLQPFATPLYSHSIVLSDGSALIFQRKFFQHARKNRLPDPSEICALDFKRHFRRSVICSVSATIGIDRSIFEVSNENSLAGPAKKDRQPYSDLPPDARYATRQAHYGADMRIGSYCCVGAGPGFEPVAVGLLAC
jgi:hypothetical protein